MLVPSTETDSVSVIPGVNSNIKIVKKCIVNQASSMSKCARSASYNCEQVALLFGSGAVLF